MDKHFKADSITPNGKSYPLPFANSFMKTVQVSKHFDSKIIKNSKTRSNAKSA
jgi:hypothetical protein